MSPVYQCPQYTNMMVLRHTRLSDISRSCVKAKLKEVERR